MRRNHPPLVGRDVELARISATLESAAAGTLKFVLLEGEPGVGKTRLMAEAFDQVGPRFRILSGQGHELGRDKPFSAFVEALDLEGETGDPDREAIGVLLGLDPATGSDLRTNQRGGRAWRTGGGGCRGQFGPGDQPT